MVVSVVLAASSFLIAALLTPLVVRFAIVFKAVDEPGERKIHSKPTPTLGGIAIFAALFLPCLVIPYLEHEAYASYTAEAHRVWALFGASLLILVLGAVDDLKGLKASSKLPVEIVAASLLYFCGFKIHVLSNPFGEAINLGMLAWPVTVLWFVGIANAVNLADGIDGAAAGITAIAALAMLVAAGTTVNAVTWIVSCCVIGATLGFLLHNFHPAKVFMGDSGALFLGFVLGAVSVLSAQKRTAAIAMSIPIAALALPIADTCLAIVRRLLKGQPIMRGDRAHVHHRLLETGMGQRSATLILYGISAVCGLAAVGLAYSGTVARLFVAGLLALFLAVVLWRLRAATKRAGLRKSGSQEMLQRMTDAKKRSPGVAHAAGNDMQPEGELDTRAGSRTSATSD